MELRGQAALARGGTRNALCGEEPEEGSLGGEDDGDEGEELEEGGGVEERAQVGSGPDGHEEELQQ
eukprot:173751-Rhodomonas_salina.2